MVGVAQQGYWEQRYAAGPAARRLDPALGEQALAAAVIRAQRGDRRGRDEALALLEPLVRGTAGRAAAHARSLRLAGPVDVDDLAQQARVALYTLMEQYNPAAGPALPFFTLRLRAAMRRYVFRLARQRPVGRHVPAHTVEAQELVDGLAGRRHTEASGWARSGGEAALHEALGQLPARIQHLLYLTYWQDRPIEEAAARLRLSTVAAQRARLRALHRLRRALHAYVRRSFPTTPRSASGTSTEPSGC